MAAARSRPSLPTPYSSSLTPCSSEKIVASLVRFAAQQGSCVADDGGDDGSFFHGSNVRLCGTIVSWDVHQCRERNIALDDLVIDSCVSDCMWNGNRTYRTARLEYCSRMHAFKLLLEMEMRVLSSSEADLGAVQYADLNKATQTKVHIHSRVQMCCALSST
ncbi:unnamed protein product [Sphagnum jensenii]|uniref:Uncharacterized protein n=1 Tax=Sphagnum jensenii TaxID=128206 RepID=A0ABP1AFE3_9BRYO